MFEKLKKAKKLFALNLKKTATGVLIASAFIIPAHAQINAHSNDFNSNVKLVKKASYVSGDYLKIPDIKNYEDIKKTLPQDFKDEIKRRVENYKASNPDMNADKFEESITYMFYLAYKGELDVEHSRDEKLKELVKKLNLKYSDEGRESYFNEMFKPKPNPEKKSNKTARIKR